MTMRDGPPRESEDREPTRLRLLARVVWNLRLLGLFLVGPVLGVVLVAAIFGLAPGLSWIAAFVFLLTLALFGVLVRGEWRRLSAKATR